MAAEKNVAQAAEQEEKRTSEDTAERPRSVRYDRHTQIQKRHHSIRSEDIAAVTTQHDDIRIDGLIDLLLFYFKEFQILLTSFIRLINTIQEIHQLIGYDENGAVVVHGIIPAPHALCWARVVYSYKKEPWGIISLKQCFGITTPMKMKAYSSHSIGCITPMGTFEGHCLEEIDPGLYSCIVESICEAGFDLNDDVLRVSVFSPIMYNKSLIIKCSGKCHHYDAAGGDTIIFSWGRQLRWKFLPWQPT